MMELYLVLSIVFMFNAAETSGLIQDEYHEELFIKPLDGYVYSYFQFSTIWEATPKDDLCT